MEEDGPPNTIFLTSYFTLPSNITTCEFMCTQYELSIEQHFVKPQIVAGSCFYSECLQFTRNISCVSSVNWK